MTLPKKIDANHMVELAADHVDWFSDMLKPLLRSWMEHGYKHGFADGFETAKAPVIWNKTEDGPRVAPMGVGD